MKIDPQGFGERLRKALEEKGWDIQTFQQTLRDRIGKARGTSYGAVWAAVNGQGSTQPWPETVEGMANLLGLNSHYLLHGTGPKSPVHAAEETAARTAVAEEPDRWVEQVVSQVAEGFGTGGEALRSPMCRAQVFHAWRRLALTREGVRLSMDGTPHGSLGQRLGEALSAPLRALGVDPATLPADALTDYVTSAATALRMACPEPADGPDKIILHLKEAEDA